MTPNKKNLQPLVITNNEDIKYAIPQSAVFLDRDGVIIEEQPNYLRSEDAINYIPGSIYTVLVMIDTYTMGNQDQYKQLKTSMITIFPLL